MFGQKQSYFTRLTKTYPILKLVDIYDRQSFIREYVLDNVYVCIFMYFLFYVAIWYANKAIKRIEKANEELMATVVNNRTKLDDVMALKDKRAEYEDIVVKAKGAQKVTAKHLDNEMKRLSTELVATANKMTELEKILGKMVFSASLGTNLGTEGKEILVKQGKETDQKGQRLSRIRSRTSRSLNRRFRRRYHRSLRPASTVSLSHGHPVTVLQQSPELHRRKSDSSNKASADTSSNESKFFNVSRITSRYIHQYEAEKKHYNVKKCPSKLSISRKASSTSLTKLDRLKVNSPFTRTIMHIGSTFFPEY